MSDQSRFVPLFSVLVLATAVAGCATPSGLTSAQIAVLQQQGFSPGADNSWQLGVADKVLFPSNSAQLNPDTATRLEGIGRTLAQVAIIRLRVEGHTDDYGTDAYNNELSQRRAQTVADEFERAGFLASNIIVRGLGKQDPVADETTPAGQSENRRVCIIVPADQ